MARDPRGGPLIPTPADAVPDDESQFDPDGVQHELRAARVLPERGFADVNDWLRRLYRDNVRHKINVKYLNGKTYEEILELIEERVAGPASSTVCNLPCFAATDGKSIQDTGISSSNILTSGRDSATPALDDLFGFWDDNDSGNPKKATLTALKTALGVGGGDVTANGTDGGDFAAANRVIAADGNNKVVKDTGVEIDPSANPAGPTIKTRNNGSGSSESLIADAGTASTTAGTVDIGTANASAVNIGRTGITITNNGAVLGKSSIKSDSPTAGIGYATGAGGAVSQTTSKSTTVVLNKTSGRITTHDANLASGAAVLFTVENSAVAEDDVPIVVIGRTASFSALSYSVHVENVKDGQFDVVLRNISGGDLAEAVRLNFALIKGVVS